MIKLRMVVESANRAFYRSPVRCSIIIVTLRCRSSGRSMSRIGIVTIRVLGLGDVADHRNSMMHRMRAMNVTIYLPVQHKSILCRLAIYITKELFDNFQHFVRRLRTPIYPRDNKRIPIQLYRVFVSVSAQNSHDTADFSSENNDHILEATALVDLPPGDDLNDNEAFDYPSVVNLLPPDLADRDDKNDENDDDAVGYPSVVNDENDDDAVDYQSVVDLPPGGRSER